LKPAVSKLFRRIREQRPEPDAERLERALSRSGIPDRVPFMELFADGEVMSAVLGKPLDYFSRELRSRKEWEERMFSLIEFYETLGYDYVRADTQGRTKDMAPELSRGERLWANEQTGVIEDWKDFESYRWEDPETIAEEGNEGLEWVCDHVP